MYICINRRRIMSLNNKQRVEYYQLLIVCTVCVVVYREEDNRGFAVVLSPHP